MSSEQVVTVITGVVQGGALACFVYHLVQGLRAKICGFEQTVKVQSETLKVMEQRVAETEKVGKIYKDLLIGRLPA